MAGAAQEREPSLQGVDIDIVLEGAKGCKIGAKSSDLGKAGHFRLDTMMAVMGGGIEQFGREDVRTLLFNRTGTVVVLENGKRFDCRNPQKLGRQTVGGDSVSREHASIRIEQGEYVYTDTDSTNGNEFFRPVTEGQRPTFTTSELAVEIEKETKFGRMVLGLGDQSIINVTYLSDGIYVITDGTPSRSGNAQKFRQLREGESISIGNAQKSQKQMGSFEDSYMNIPDQDIAAEEVRLTIIDGNLYILNIAKNEFDIHFERLALNPNPRVRKPKPRPTPPPPGPNPPPPGPEKAAELKRLPTALLWSEVQTKIKDLEKVAAYKGDRNKLYKALVNLYHPDRNRQDPSANRRFQLINKWYTGFGN